MVAVPTLTAVAFEPLTLRTAGLLLDQVTDWVQSLLELSDIEQLATNDSVWPTSIAGELGVTAMLESVGALEPPLPLPPVPPEPPPAFAELEDPEPQAVSARMKNEAVYTRRQPDSVDLFFIGNHHQELRRTATYDGGIFQNVGPEFRLAINLRKQQLTTKPSPAVSAQGGLLHKRIDQLWTFSGTLANHFARLKS